MSRKVIAKPTDIMKADTKVYTSTMIAALGGLRFSFDTAIISGTKAFQPIL